MSNPYYPNGVKSEKYLLTNFVYEETGKTARKFQSDPEEPLNKLIMKEIDTSEQILWEFVKNNCLKSCKNRGQFVGFLYGILTALANGCHF